MTTEMTTQFTSHQDTMRQYEETADAIMGQTSHRPAIGLILGSGLSLLADAVEDATILPYGELPHFPVSTVEGHAGRLVIGKLAGVTVCVMQGRFHAYEGYSLQQTTFPIRVMHLMGVRTLILTNAAGGVNPDFAVGDLMLIEDHINYAGMAGFNPLIGPNLDEFGPRFPAMNRTYTRQLRDLATRVAEQHALPLRRGVYTFLSGPTFESPAEIRMLRRLGADAVGMSTVPEAIVARHAGMELLAISTITNICIDELDAESEPTHEEVQAAGKVIVPRLTTLLMGILGQIDAERMSNVTQDFWNESYKEDASQVLVPDLVLDDEIQTLPVGQALDLGCGSGDNALKLAARGWSVVGVDWAEHAIELARSAAQTEGLDAVFEVADLTTWQPMQQFDLVISTYSLPGGEANESVLATAAAALRVGGTLLVVEWDRSMAAVWGVAEDEFTSPSQIVDLLPGLVIEKAEVRHLEKMFAPDDMRALHDMTANVAVVRARKV